MKKKVAPAVVQYKDLVALGYTVGASRSVIKQAKQIMVNKGFTFMIISAWELYRLKLLRKSWGLKLHE